MISFGNPIYVCTGNLWEPLFFASVCMPNYLVFLLFIPIWHNILKDPCKKIWKYLTFFYIYFLKCTFFHLSLCRLTMLSMLLHKCWSLKMIPQNPWVYKGILKTLILLHCFIFQKCYLLICFSYKILCVPHGSQKK